MKKHLSRFKDMPLQYKLPLEETLSFSLPSSPMLGNKKTLLAETSVLGGFYSKAVLGGTYIPAENSFLEVTILYSVEPSKNKFVSFLDPAVSFQKELNEDFAKEVQRAFSTYAEKNQLFSGIVKIDAAGTSEEFTSHKSIEWTTHYLLDSFFDKASALI